MKFFQFRLTKPTFGTLMTGISVWNNMDMVGITIQLFSYGFLLEFEIVK